MGCDLEGFVVKCDQQCTEDEQAGNGGVGIVVSKSDASVRNASAATQPTRFCRHRKKNMFRRRKNQICHCAAVLRTQVPKLCTALDLSLLYILILGTYRKFAGNNDFLALGVCFPQPCSSAGRGFAASRSRLQNYRRIVSFPHQKIR